MLMIMTNTLEYIRKASMFTMNGLPDPRFDDHVDLKNKLKWIRRSIARIKRYLS